MRSFSISLVASAVYVLWGDLLTMFLMCFRWLRMVKLSLGSHVKSGVVFVVELFVEFLAVLVSHGFFNLLDSYWEDLRLGSNLKVAGGVECQVVLW